MRDLRWVAGPVDCTDYVDANDPTGNRMHGYVMPISDGVWGYALRRRADGVVVMHALEDHPDEPSARAWVEAEIRRSSTASVPAGGSDPRGEHGR